MRRVCVDAEAAAAALTLAEEARGLLIRARVLAAGEEKRVLSIAFADKVQVAPPSEIPARNGTLRETVTALSRSIRQYLCKRDLVSPPKSENSPAPTPRQLPS